MVKLISPVVLLRYAVDRYYPWIYFHDIPLRDVASCEDLVELPQCNFRIVPLDGVIPLSYFYLNLKYNSLDMLPPHETILSARLSIPARNWFEQVGESGIACKSIDSSIYF